MPTFADLNDRIAFFFDEPTHSPDVHKRDGVASVLYLLRRELIETAGWDPGAGEDEQKVYDNGVRNRLFASLIVMFTGFDLLAKFQFGDKTGEVGKRFKDFLMSPDGGGTTELEARIFYGVRNSLTHSFSVPDAEALAKLGMQSVGIARRYEGTYGGTRGVSTLTVQSGDVALIYVDGVYRTFFTAVRRLQDSLYGGGSSDARTMFEAMFDKYGTLHVV
jgi:hypothetical protein